MEYDKEISLDLIKEKIEFWAIRLGYMNYKRDIIYASKFDNDFRMYCNSLDIKLEHTEDCRNVLRAVINGKRRLLDVFTYLLIINFLVGSVNKLINSNPAILMPSEKSWPCKNPLCSFFEKDVIQLSNINIYKDQNSGNFTCPHCEMRYMATWDKSFEILKYKIVWYGKDWYNNVYKIYLQNQMNARKTARAIGVKHENIYFVLKVINQKRLESVDESQNNIKLINSMREKLVSVLKDNPNATRTEVAKLISRGVYDRLREMDLNWLDSVLPHSNNTKNYAKLDEILLSRVHTIIEDLYSNPPSRLIKKSTIIGKLKKDEQNKLFNVPSKFPKCTELIVTSLESKEHYQLRQIDYNIRQLKKHSYSRPTLQNMLQLNAYKDCSFFVIESIRKRLVEYGLV